MWPFASRSYRSRPVQHAQIGELNSSQARVLGFDYERCQDAKILIVGAGALGCGAAHMLVRKGFGHIRIADDDRVELSNLTRQLYGRADIGKYKAFALARDLSREGLFPVKADGYRLRFQEIVERKPQLVDSCDIWLILVDNDQARHDACEEALKRDKPLITAALARDATSLYCAVQEAGKACLACIRPQLSKPSGEYPCNLPGIIDISMVAASLVAFAVDSIVGSRAREWNLRTIVLDGSMPERCEMVPRNPQCRLCRDMNVAAEQRSPEMEGAAP